LVSTRHHGKHRYSIREKGQVEAVQAGVSGVISGMASSSNMQSGKGLLGGGGAEMDEKAPKRSSRGSTVKQTLAVVVTLPA
jgi:hypothetical protein